MGKGGCVFSVNCALGSIDQHKAGSFDPDKIEIEALELHGETYEAATRKANELFRKWKESVKSLTGETEDDPSMISDD